MVRCETLLFVLEKKSRKVLKRAWLILWCCSAKVLCNKELEGWKPSFHLFPAVPVEREIITLEGNCAYDGWVVVTMLGFITISPEGLLIFFPAKCTLRWGGLIHWNPAFVVPHLTVLWINSLCFGQKYLLPRVIPALCSKSRAELSSSSGWRICLEIVPALVWNYFKGWDLVTLVGCSLLEAVIGKPHLSLFFLFIKTFLPKFH